MARRAEPSAKRSLRDRVVDQIRKEIIDGKLVPGQPLVESRLAERFGVSRVPVREALQRLAEQGFVELRPGHSARVAQRSARDIIEMFEVRAVIEGLACALVAARRSDEGLTSLKECVRAGFEATENERWDEAAQCNREFHDLLAGMTGNNHLVELIQGYRNRLAWLSEASAEQRGVGAWEEHAEVVEAIAAQDAEAAERLGRRHVAATKEAFTQAFLEGTISL